MASLETAFYLGFCLSLWVMATAVEDVPKAENVHWVSFDFKTILHWTSRTSDSTYTVVFRNVGSDGDWEESHGCINTSEAECDMTNDLLLDSSRTYEAKIQSEAPDGMDYEYADLPYTYSPKFNPLKESRIGAPSFTVVTAEDNRVTVNISDPLTSIYEGSKLRTVRDILKQQLQYKIRYHKAGSTGKKDQISLSSTAEFSKLDAGVSYCFQVAAWIPSRPNVTLQLGAWSKQQCIQAERNLIHELRVEALVGGLFGLLILLIIIVTVTVLCCTGRCPRPRKTQTAPPPDKTQIQMQQQTATV